MEKQFRKWVFEGQENLLDIHNMFPGPMEKYETIVIPVFTKKQHHYKPTLFCELKKNGLMEPAKFRDFPLLGKETWLEFARQKYVCTHCGAFVNEVTREFDDKRRMTVRFKRHVEKASVKRSFTDAALVCGVNRSLVERCFDDYAERHLKNYHFDMPRILGLDEKYIKGKPKFIVGNIETRRMLDMQATRLTEDITPYFEAMEDRHKVEVVCQDMYSPYKNVTKKMFKKAVTVVDKFHVVKMGNLGVDNVRKMVQKSLPDEDRIKLKRIHKNLLARRDNPKEGVQFFLEYIFERYPVIKKAYDVKEGLYEIYDAPDRYEGSKMLSAWIKHMPPEFETHFKDSITAVGNCRPHILRYFEYPFTNAYVEALNGLIDEMNRIGRGYKYETLRAKALLKFGDIRDVHYSLHGVPEEEWDDILNTTYSDGVDVQRALEEMQAEAFEL